MSAMKMKRFVGILALALASASFAQAAFIDTTTSGNWIGAYGGDGYILTNYDGDTFGYWWDGVYYEGGVNHAPPVKSMDVASLPSFVTDYAYSATAMSNKWASPPATALQDPRNPSGARKAGFIYGSSTTVPFTLSLTLANDAPRFQLGVYAYEAGGDADTITTKWSGESAAFDSVELSSIADGKWALFDVNPSGKTQLDITFTIGPNATKQEAIFQGITFNAIPEPGTLVLLATGLLGLLAYAWRRRK